VSKLTPQSCVCRINDFTNSDLGLRLSEYFTTCVLLHVAHKILRNGFNDNLMDILSTVLGQFSNIPPRYSKRQSSVLSLNKAAKLMKVVANKLMSSEQLIETELSKAYLYRALRCKDSDNDSIYCVANVYLAVLYYTRGQCQTAIDHCTLVTRLQDHSQCSSQIVQGELLPKIDDNIDNILGLTVFYQYVISAALNQQLQRKYVSVFTTEMFAYYLHCRLLSVAKCPFVTSMLHDAGHQWVKCISKMRQLFIGDVLILKSLNIVLNQNVNNKPQWSKRRPTAICQNDANTKLVELLHRGRHAKIFGWAKSATDLSMTDVLWRKSRNI